MQAQNPSTLGQSAGQMVPVGPSGASLPGVGPRKGIGGGTVAIIIGGALVLVVGLGVVAWRVLTGVGETANQAVAALGHGDNPEVEVTDTPADPEPAPDPTPDPRGKRKRGARTADPAAATADPADGDSFVLSGACGRFDDLHVLAPRGFSILGCTDSGADSASLVLTGNGEVRAACAVLRRWAVGAGYSLDNQALVGQTVSYLMHQDDHNLVVACTRSNGMTLATVNIAAR